MVTNWIDDLIVAGSVPIGTTYEEVVEALAAQCFTTSTTPYPLQTFGGVFFRIGLIEELTAGYEEVWDFPNPDPANRRQDGWTIAVGKYQSVEFPQFETLDQQPSGVYMVFPDGIGGNRVKLWLLDCQDPCLCCDCDCEDCQ